MEEEKKPYEEVEEKTPDCSPDTSTEDASLLEEEASPELKEAEEDMASSDTAEEAKAILESKDDEIEDESEITSDEINDEKMSPEILEDAIKRRDVTKLRDFLTYIPDVDIAQAASELEDVKDLIYLFRHTPSESAAVIFDELPDEVKEELVTAMSDRELIRIINESSIDDVADTVDSMPANIAVRILKAADKDMRADLNKLLKYEDDTAGAIMTTEFLEFKSNVTVSSAIETIRKIGRKAETVYTIFVRNDKRKFVGTVNLDDLIFANGKERLYEIMAKDAPFVHVNTDKEEVANMMAKYNLHALAVLNDDDCLTGIVTIDDAIDVAMDEANEDIEKMNAVGTLEHSYLETKPISMAKKCVPWIIVLLVLSPLAVSFTS